MFTRTIAIITVVSMAMLIVLLFTTNPSTTGPLGILGFFVFMYLTALGVLTFLLRAVSVLVMKFASRGNAEVYKLKNVSLRTSYYYGSVLALVPVMLIAIHSVGEVGIYQILLIVFFIVIAWIYVANRTS